MVTAQQVVGLALSVVATACITISNKDLLTRLSVLGLASPQLLLVLHRCVSYISVKLSYVCTDPPSKRYSVPWSWVIFGSLASNFSIIFSFLVLQEASVTFHQLSRLIIMPMSAAVDYVAYGKKRTLLDYSSILLICYGVTIGLHGEITATPRAIGYAILCSATTIASSAIGHHVITTLSAKPRELLAQFMPYEIAMSVLLLFFYQAMGIDVRPSQVSSAGAASVDAVLLLLVVLNCATAASVVYLTTWSQGVVSNMMYAVLGQTKMLATVALDAAIFSTTLSIRTKTGLVIVITVALGVALGDPKKHQPQQEEQKGLESADEHAKRGARRAWIARVVFFSIPLILIAHDAATRGKADIMGSRIDISATAKPTAKTPKPRHVGSRHAASNRRNATRAPDTTTDHWSEYNGPGRESAAATRHATKPAHKHQAAPHPTNNPTEPSAARNATRPAYPSRTGIHQHLKLVREHQKSASPEAEGAARKVPLARNATHASRRSRLDVISSRGA